MFFSTILTARKGGRNERLQSSTWRLGRLEVGVGLELVLELLLDRALSGEEVEGLVLDLQLTVHFNIKFERHCDAGSCYSCNGTDLRC